MSNRHQATSNHHTDSTVSICHMMHIRHNTYSSINVQWDIYVGWKPVFFFSIVDWSSHGVNALCCVLIRGASWRSRHKTSRYQVMSLARFRIVSIMKSVSVLDWIRDSVFNASRMLPMCNPMLIEVTFFSEQVNHICEIKLGMAYSDTKLY